MDFKKNPWTLFNYYGQHRAGSAIDTYRHNIVYESKMKVVKTVVFEYTWKFQKSEYEKRNYVF